MYSFLTSSRVCVQILFSKSSTSIYKIHLKLVWIYKMWDSWITFIYLLNKWTIIIWLKFIFNVIIINNQQEFICLETSLERLGRDIRRFARIN